MYNFFFYYLLLRQILSTECDIGYGIDKRAKSKTKGQCIPCQSYSCYSCASDANICTNCLLGDLDEDKGSLTYGKCTKKCSDFYCTNCEGDKCLSCSSTLGVGIGYGVDENGKCKQCADPNCVRCNKDYKVCIECERTSGKGPDLDSSSATYGQCISSKAENCLEAYYLDASLCSNCQNGYTNNNNKCDKCKIEHCWLCPDQKCLDCEDPFVLKDNKCIRCPEKCTRCTSEHCISCINGYYLDNNGECVNSGFDNCQRINFDYNKCSACNDGYGFDYETNQCFKCTDPNCLYCGDDYQKCTQCAKDFLIEDLSKCVKNCAVEHCQECSSKNNDYCLTCDVGYGGSSCDKCSDPNCIQCNQSANSCLKCAPNFCLDESSYECVKSNIENCDDCKQNYKGDQTCNNCLFGYYLNDNSKCEKCENDCEYCKGSTGICSSCKDGMMPDYSKGSKSYGMCSGATNKDLLDEDGPIPEWAIIVIIVVCCVIVIVVIAVIIYCVCKKKKNGNSESP